MGYTNLKTDLDNIVLSLTFDAKVLDVVGAIIATLELHGITVFDGEGSITREAEDQFTLVFGDMVGRILLTLCVDGSPFSH